MATALTTAAAAALTTLSAAGFFAATALTAAGLFAALLTTLSILVILHSVFWHCLPSVFEIIPDCGAQLFAYR
jgi:hypothetical protein